MTARLTIAGLEAYSQQLAAARRTPSNVQQILAPTGVALDISWQAFSQEAQVPALDTVLEVEPVRLSISNAVLELIPSGDEDPSSDSRPSILQHLLQV